MLDGVEPFDYLEDGAPTEPERKPDPGGTHRYMGGGNDTGTCDECGRSREDGVHRVAEGKTRHKPWQGEDQKGPCDLCFQPVDAAIHGSAPVPEPDTDTEPEPEPELVPHIYRGTASRCTFKGCGRAKSNRIPIKDAAAPDPDDNARIVRIEQSVQRIEAILERVFRA